ncbi:MAG: hypothetical protein LBI42_08850 [Chitinispirillales bacterium]|jgi:hypothetical protein|nr:hypothetical protein [Chitinispirillales bacterium]
MKKFLVAAIIIICCFMITGCYSVKMNANPNNEVRLISANDNASFKHTQRQWFALWGLVPLTEDGVQKSISNNGLTEVRVSTKYTVIDWLISGVLGSITVGTRTVVLEGNGK